eukprot:CAMPEP_0201727896 /NCGR_PEP_ID=MMETSP0593-20130828/13927_1 /ASSEMBLY_ACC=CAM_ASM_000672 /TAXON_ID=267983 /ORGANISM="Skeletonema japonicum, Strain CCMP2506" /LENGTH=56 /DNA_ID=CAMNT_0048219833 /DNA_START=206 /DNA_END=372 /DNA_ORIENTATION=-
MMVSFFSLLHVSYLAILLGNHLVQGIPQHQHHHGSINEPFNGVIEQLQQLSARTTS